MARQHSRGGLLHQTLKNNIIMCISCVSVLLQSVLLAGGLLSLCLLTVGAQAGCGPNDLQTPVPVPTLCVSNAACSSPSCKCDMSYSCEFGTQYLSMTDKCAGECQWFLARDLRAAPMSKSLRAN